MEDLKARTALAAGTPAACRVCAAQSLTRSVCPQAEASSSSSSGEPKRDSPRSSGSAAVAADAVKVQQKGRFEVYDSNDAASNDAAGGSEARALRPAVPPCCALLLLPRAL